MKYDPEFRDKINAKKREYHQRQTAHIPKPKRGRKPQNKELNDTENNDDSNESSNDTKSIDGEYKQVESKHEEMNEFKDLSKYDITSLIELLQKQVNQSQQTRVNTYIFVFLFDLI